MQLSTRELELVAAAQAGDKIAFGQLAERFMPMAITLARRMTGNRDLAHELTQEALLQAYLSLAYLREARAFPSWFYGIVLNVCRSQHRQRRREPLSLEALVGGLHFDALPFRAAGPSPQEVAEAQELHTLVLTAVHALSPKNRDATLLFYYEQLSLHEIATLLGISVTAVKGRLNKARSQLRALLGPLLETPMDGAPPAAPDEISERKKPMVRVTIADIVHQEEGDSRVIVLYDEANGRILPIWIGSFEADAIALPLLNRTLPRPLTYDLMISLLQAIGATIEEVRVETLKQYTYYAVIKVRAGATVSEIDARPSDGLALAARIDCPILVAEEVLAQAGAQIPPESPRAPLRKGLQSAAEKLDKLQQEAAAKLAVAAEEAQTKADAARQRLLTYLFGE